jgi:hypothetical protein
MLIGEVTLAMFFFILVEIDNRGLLFFVQTNFNCGACMFICCYSFDTHITTQNNMQISYYDSSISSAGDIKVPPASTGTISEDQASMVYIPDDN